MKKELALLVTDEDVNMFKDINARRRAVMDLINALTKLHTETTKEEDRLFRQIIKKYNLPNDYNYSLNNETKELYRIIED